MIHYQLYQIIRIWILFYMGYASVFISIYGFVIDAQIVMSKIIPGYSFMSVVFSADLFFATITAAGKIQCFCMSI